MLRNLEVLDALTRAGIGYVVVGGVAVILRGHIRATVDLDLAIDLSTDNVSTALTVLQELGLRPRLPVAAEQFADPATRRAWVEERNLVAFTLHDPDDPLREVDLLATTAVPYADLAASADWIPVGGVQVPVASTPHLVAMKQSSGRAQDVADIAALSALAEGATVDDDDGHGG